MSNSTEDFLNAPPDAASPSGVRTICLLTFRSLPRRLLGCYGNIDAATPGFDALASLATLFDAAYADRPGALPDESLGWPCGSWGGEQLFVDDGRSPRPTLADLVEEALARLKRGGGDRALVRIDHPGLGATGDAQSQRPDAATPLGTDPQAAVLARLDEELAEALQLWRSRAGEEQLWIIAGLIGGPPESCTPSPAPLCAVDGSLESARETSLPLDDDRVHVPLWMLEGGGRLPGRRTPALVALTDLGKLLADWRRGGASTDSSLASLARGDFPGRSSIIICGPGGPAAVRTTDWFFRAATNDTPERLHSKPDDVRDVFDVGFQHPDVVVELAGLLATTPDRDASS